MRSPCGIGLVENCQHCQIRAEGFFCDLPEHDLRKFQTLKLSHLYPKGTILFLEDNTAHGIYILCQGRVKLSTCSREGKVVILHIAGPGEVLGLSAAVSQLPYEVTAEALEPCQANFVRAVDFLCFLREYPEASLSVARQLSRNYHRAYVRIRSLGLSSSAAEKLARLLLNCCAEEGRPTAAGVQLRLGLTHEEISEMIGTSRETVSRLFKEFREKEIITCKGAQLLIPDARRLESFLSA